MASIVIRNATTVPKLQASRSRSIASSSIKSRRPQFRVSRPRLTVHAFTEEKAPGEAPMAAFANQLEALKAVSTVVADTGDINSVRKYAPVDCTTNPSLVLKAVQMPEYEYLLTSAIAEEKASGNAVDPERPFAGVADRLAVAMGCELLKIVPGRVSTEVDAHLSYDTEATVAKAKRLVQLYEEKGINARERVYIKIASTFEGIQACRKLQQEGIACNMTLLFSFGQAAACADAGASLISPFVGRILDWYKKAEGRDYAPEEDPGVLSVRRIYNYYKTHGYSTIVMAASFRNIGEIQQLAGCDNITISPALLEELGQCTEELPTMLLEPKAASSDPKYENIDLAAFSKLHNTDAMAVEKLKEGIDNFAADQRKLEALLAELAK